MTVTKKKRGGRRLRNARAPGNQRGKNAYQLLITELIHYFGGPKKIAELVSKKTGEPVLPQSFIDWRSKGTVTFKRVASISKALNVPPEALNYKDSLEIGILKHPWQKLIAHLGEKGILDREQRGMILRAKRPE